MTTKRITIKQATDELKQNQISLTKTEGEYRVAPKGTRRDDTYGSAYFTNDLHDALMTGLAMARKAGTLVTRVERTSLATAVEYHNTPVVKPLDTMEFKGGASLKTVGGTFKAKATAWGNWYGYQGSKRVTMFFGDYTDQMFEAAQWLKTLEQAAALKGSR
jgi:hypothetical protein